jgi:hypothetical protein
LDVFPKEWGVLVLPYLPAARERLKEAAVLRAARQLAAARFQTLILGFNGLSTDDGWRLGIVSVDHPEGDKEPGTWKPHHNFLFPSLAFGPSGERRAIRYTFTKEQLATLRAAWGELQSILIGAPVASANIWYQFRVTRKQKNHAAKYFPRTFPRWSARGQQLSYMGAFGCSVIRELPELLALRTTVKEAKEAQALCRVCRKQIVHRSCSTQCIPSHFRAVSGSGGPDP